VPAAETLAAAEPHELPADHAAPEPHELPADDAAPEPHERAADHAALFADADEHPADNGADADRCPVGDAGPELHADPGSDADLRSVLDRDWLAAGHAAGDPH
jgi:hypothetical protein